MTLQKIFLQVSRKIRARQDQDILSHLEFTGNGFLCSLPLDILHIIAGYLSPSSLAILTLCSKVIRYKLGARYHKEDIKDTIEHCADKCPPLQYFLKMYWTYQQMYWSSQLPPKLPEFKMFLYLIARDSSSQIFCFRCGKIHSPDRSDKINLWWPWSWKNCGSFDGSLMQIYYGRHFHFEGAQLAMQQYRRGTYPKNQLKKLSKISVFIGKPLLSDSELRKLCSLQARIISNRLYVKTVRKRNCTTEASNSIFDTISRRLYICPHLMEHQCSIIDTANFGIVQDGPHIDKIQTDDTALSRCSHCFTEVHMKVFEIKKRYVSSRTVIVTIWQDFGTLSHPADPDWYSHLDTITSSTLVQFPPGSIRKTFESASE
ncbi:hypothetical protein GcM3_144010 [Golovinomyces cichoracearum]|uniref:F-box domain-containing protein n=1 Tax=Golovinomyces cichoracearum TaxID=62708 RepID=A0A420HZH8_9PEZI|nr:hypothetical protein GcM3_144010 [Golovinomyces cichoracearum]